MAGWDPLARLLREEVKQRQEEGCDVSSIESQVEQALASADDAQLNAAYDALMALPIRADFPYVEPSGLKEIRAARPDSGQARPAPTGDEDWSDRFLGAWLGRCAGCALGKPMEAGPFMSGRDGHAGWENVRRWFAGADAFPISGYAPEHSRAEQDGLHHSGAFQSTREHIRFMESDDDIRYTVVGLALLEEKGSGFTTWDVGKNWHRRLTYDQMCTAETQVYQNFSRITAHTMRNPTPEALAELDWVRTYRNPYREWIGAQIRVDPYGYAAAGRPELAAEFAWRDASLSHVKNGIYGAMFVAAMIAAAFVETDNEQIVRRGLREIPQNSRLAHDVADALDIAKSSRDQLELVSRIWERYKHYHPVHTNNNAALVAAALVFAGDDFEKAITTAVLGGWDTDCNGATVGSIMGAKLGASRLPHHWTAPLNDTLYADVIGFHPIPISECARRSERVFQKLLNER